MASRTISHRKAKTKVEISENTKSWLTTKANIFLRQIGNKLCTFYRKFDNFSFLFSFCRFPQTSTIGKALESPPEKYDKEKKNILSFVYVLQKKYFEATFKLLSLLKRYSVHPSVGQQF